MIIGVPKEIKIDEYRVALVPSGAEILIRNGHTVLIEKSAGEGSGFPDGEYERQGAILIDAASELFSKADCIVKVKELQPGEYPHIRRNQLIFTYFHFAASQSLTEAMVASGATCIAYETVQLKDGSLPLLIPMSEIAGRLSVQFGAACLEKTSGGRGILISGVPGVEPAEITIIGGGVVGTNAAMVASGMRARITILDTNLSHLRYLMTIMPNNVRTLISNSYNIRSCLPQTDLLIGAVLLPGARTPKIVSREMLRLMKPGSAVVDVAVDQGGCIETARPTTHRNPTYIEEGIIHHCVSNMPAVVPDTATKSLTNATFPYVLDLANYGIRKVCEIRHEMAAGVTVFNHKITNKDVAETFNLSYIPFQELLSL